MMTKIEKSFLTAEEKNNLYKAGYRYIVKGDHRTIDSIDPWSGMPNTTNNIYAFTDKAEADAFAVTQLWGFNPNIHEKAVELPAHTKTLAEINEEEAKKKAERKAKRKANEAKKAAEAGVTVEEYRANRKRINLTKRLKREIAELETLLAQKKDLLKKLED